MSDAINFLNLLGYALKNYPDKLVIHPVLPNTTSVARQNLKRPAYLQMAVPDEWARNVKGKNNLVDVYACIRIEREVLDRFKSGILLPGEE